MTAISNKTAMLLLFGSILAWYILFTMSPNPIPLLDKIVNMKDDKGCVKTSTCLGVAFLFGGLTLVAYIFITNRKPPK